MGNELHATWEGAFIPVEHWHFHSQLYRRYGIVLAPGEFGWIIAQIVKGKAIVVREKPGQAPVFCVKLPSTWDKLYIAAEGRRIVTALSPSRQLNQLRKAALARRKEGGNRKTPEVDQQDAQSPSAQPIADAEASEL